MDIKLTFVKLLSCYITWKIERGNPFGMLLKIYDKVGHTIFYMKLKAQGHILLLLLLLLL